jgi:hypothetical protein
MTDTEPTFTITTSRTVELHEVVDMMDNVWRDQSPWVGSIERKTTAKWRITYSAPENDEGDFAAVTLLTAQQLVDAFQKARDNSSQVLGEGKGHYGLCCLDVMEREELGLGCAQDHDTVLQYAILGELVFG